jgi:hypothetical protein
MLFYTFLLPIVLSIGPQVKLPSCPKDSTQIGALCYADCEKGYHLTRDKGIRCYKDCIANYTTEPGFLRCRALNPTHGGKWPDTYSKGSTSRRLVAKVCPEGTTKILGLCYY